MKFVLAISKDNEEQVFGMIEGIPPCSWDASPPERVVAENKSQAIVIEVASPTDSECESTISLRAPGFDISPYNAEQKIALEAGKEGSLSWILNPRKTGTYEIAVSDILNTKIFGITVTNVFGLNAMQAKIASFGGTLFGPMLTVPWWWDRLRKKKENTQTQKDNSSVNS